jgi:CheY-like chemotaxis protein
MILADKLFGVFQRLHSSDDFEGIGIGLANVKQIILKHNGHISVDSKINEGTTLPIIALTAYALDSDRRTLLEMVFSEYIAKPVNHKNIIEKINCSLHAFEK